MMSPRHAYSDFHSALPLPDPGPASGSTDASATTRAPAARRDRGGVVGRAVVEHDDLGRRGRGATASATIAPMVGASLRAGRHTETRGRRSRPSASARDVRDCTRQPMGEAHVLTPVGATCVIFSPDNALIESGRGTGPLTPRQPAKTRADMCPMVRARCQCLTDEQPKSGLQESLEALGARREQRGDAPMVHVQGLRCRECGREYDAAPIFTCEWCFGPLEVAYDYDAIAGVGRAARRSRPARRASGATPTCCRSRADPAVDLGTGFTPLVRADRLAAELGLGEVWVKNDTRNPTNSFKDRVVSVALEQGARVRVQGRRRARRPATSRTRSPRTRRAPGCAATCSSRPTSSRARSSPPRSTAATSSRSRATTTTSTGCAPSSPASTTGRSSTSTCGRTTPRARRRSRSRPPSSSAGSVPDHVVVPVASGSLLTKIRKGFDELHKVGLLDEEPHVRVSGAQALGCSPVAKAFIEEADTIRPVKPDTIAKSLAIGNPGRRLLRARRRAHHRRRVRRRSPTARSSTACSCSRAPRGSSPRPRAA